MTLRRESSEASLAAFRAQRASRSAAGLHQVSKVRVWARVKVRVRATVRVRVTVTVTVTVAGLHQVSALLTTTYFTLGCTRRGATSP